MNAHRVKRRSRGGRKGSGAIRGLVTSTYRQLAHSVRRIWRDHDLFLPEKAVLDQGKREAIQEMMYEDRPQVLILIRFIVSISLIYLSKLRMIRVRGSIIGNRL